MFLFKCNCSVLQTIFVCLLNIVKHYLAKEPYSLIYTSVYHSKRNHFVSGIDEFGMDSSMSASQESLVTDEFEFDCEKVCSSVMSLYYIFSS